MISPPVGLIFASKYFKGSEVGVGGNELLAKSIALNHANFRRNLSMFDFYSH